MNKRIMIFGCAAVAIMLASVASAASNQLWTPGGNQLFGDVVNWVSDGVPAPGLADDDVLYINTSDELTCPIISADTNGIYPYSVTDIRVGEAFGSSIGPGLLKQTGGTQDIAGALVVGNGAVTGNPVSKFIMSGGTLNKYGSSGDPLIGAGGGYGEVEVGTGATLNLNTKWAWVGKDSGSQGTLKLTGGTMLVGESLRVGADGGNGDLSLTNGSNLTIYQELSVAAWGGGTGSLSVADSTVLVYNNLRVGDGAASDTTATLSGTTTVTVNAFDGESRFGQGSHLDLNMRNGAVLDIGGLAEAPQAQTINFGSWDGGSIAIDMTGTSKILAKSSMPDGDGIRLGRNSTGTSTLTMTDNAEFKTYGYLDAGRGGDGLNIELHKSAKIIAEGFTRMNGDGAVGNVTLGTLDAIDEDASISVTRSPGIYDDALDTGSWGGQSTWKMYAQTHLQVNGNAILGGGYNGNCTFDMYNSASVDVTMQMFAGQYNGTSAVTIHGGALTTTSDLSVGLQWWNDVNDQGTHSMTVAGGTVSVGGKLILGANGGKGAYTQGSGHTTVTDAVILGQGDYSSSVTNRVGSHGEAVLNLNGGTLTAPRLTTQSQVVSTWETTNTEEVGYPGDSGTLLHMVTNAQVNFNGGVLEASADSADFIATDDTLATLTLNVLEGGAKIDPNGNEITITKALAGDVAGRSLQVLNSNATPGVLTLTGPVTNIGPVSIDSGATLQMNNGTTTFTDVAGAGTLKVVDGSTLYAASINVDTLVIGGTASAASLTAVPEPGTLTLMALAGLFSIGALLRRR